MLRRLNFGVVEEIAFIVLGLRHSILWGDSRFNSRNLLCIFLLIFKIDLLEFFVKLLFGNRLHQRSFQSNFDVGLVNAFTIQLQPIVALGIQLLTYRAHGSSDFVLGAGAWFFLRFGQIKLTHFLFCHLILEECLGVGLDQIRHLILQSFEAFFFGLSWCLHDFCDLEYIFITYGLMFRLYFLSRIIHRLLLLNPDHSLILLRAFTLIRDPYLVNLRNHPPSLLLQPLLVLSFENEGHVAGTAVQLVIKGGLLIIVVCDDKAIIDKILVFLIIVVLCRWSQIITFIEVLSISVCPLLLGIEVILNDWAQGFEWSSGRWEDQLGLWAHQFWQMLFVLGQIKLDVRNTWLINIDILQSCVEETAIFAKIQGLVASSVHGFHVAGLLIFYLNEFLDQLEDISGLSITDGSWDLIFILPILTPFNLLFWRKF